jgi:hypothetical protein
LFGSLQTSLLLQAIGRLPCRSHFAVHADQSGLQKSRKQCLVFLLSKRVSLNIEGVNAYPQIPLPKAEIDAVLEPLFGRPCIQRVVKEGFEFV